VAEQLNITSANRAEQYAELFPQLKALIGGETDPIANMANFAAALRQTFGFFWVGFYLVRDNELVLGPFQGDIACTRIAFGKGVCGSSWQQKQTIVVPDVDAFPGHIACSSLSRSEIVVPIISNGTVVAVLDVDSHLLNDFDETDRTWLERYATIISPYLK
jgi:GAF domain-containing protein